MCFENGKFSIHFEGIEDFVNYMNDAARGDGYFEAVRRSEKILEWLKKAAKVSFGPFEDLFSDLIEDINQLNCEGLRLRCQN